MLNQIRYCIFFAIIFVPALSLAQTRGKVEVVKDPLIDTLIARRPYLNKSNATGDETSASGYRVQIFFGSNRQAAYNARLSLRTSTRKFIPILPTANQISKFMPVISGQGWKPRNC